MVAYTCQLYHGDICQRHCGTCEYHEDLTDHCTYYIKNIAPDRYAQEAAAYRQHRIDKTQQRIQANLDRMTSHIQAWKEKHAK